MFGLTRVRREIFGIKQLLLTLIVGAMFLGFGLMMLKGSRINPGWSRVDGEVVEVTNKISDGSTLYAPVVQYQVNGATYKMTSSSSSSFYPTIGSKREVAYNPSNPENAQLVEGIGVNLLFYSIPAIGAFLIGWGIIAFILSMRRGLNIQKLKFGGHKVQGVLIDLVEGGASNNKNSYRLVVAATDPAGVVQNYTSDTVSGVAGIAMADFRNNPIPIDVYIDPANHEHYYVDISDIPNLSPERIQELIQSALKKYQKPPAGVASPGQDN